MSRPSPSSSSAAALAAANYRVPFKNRVNDQLTLDPIEERSLAEDRRKHSHWRGEDSVERDAAMGLQELQDLASDGQSEDPIAKQAIQMLDKAAISSPSSSYSSYSSPSSSYSSPSSSYSSPSSSYSSSSPQYLAAAPYSFHPSQPPQAYPAPSAPSPYPAQPSLPPQAAPQPSFSPSWSPGGAGGGAGQQHSAASWGGRLGGTEGLPQVGDPLPDAYGLA